MEPGFAPSEIDTTRPHPARMYDFYLGGKDNYLVDRQAAAQVLRTVPEVRIMARENRAFLQRAVRFLAGEAGIRQIIDIGTGIPAAGNVHEVAQQIAPEVRVAYVDNDPIVHVHASALLTGSGATSIVLADLRKPETILAHPKVRQLIDFRQPVALLLIAILHFITAGEHPASIVAAFRDTLAPDSLTASTTRDVPASAGNPNGSRPGRRVTKVWDVDATASAIIELGEHLAGLGIEKVTVESADQMPSRPDLARRPSL